MGSYHNSKHYGRWAGMSVGCLIGAIAALPFLTFDSDDTDGKSKDGKKATTVKSVECQVANCSAKTNYTYENTVPRFCSSCGIKFTESDLKVVQDKVNVKISTIELEA